MTIKELTTLTNPVPADVRALVQEALRALVDSRQAEGRITVAAMQGHLDELVKLRLEAVERAPAIVDAYRDKLKKRLEEYLAENGVTLEARDLVREVGLFADRSDVSEELQRLEAHERDARPVGEQPTSWRDQRSDIRVGESVQSLDH